MLDQPDARPEVRAQLVALGVVIHEPEVDETLGGVWRCWHRLSRDRPWRGGGMGPAAPGGIPWEAVRDWCQFHALPGDEVAFYDLCIREMDAVFMQWWTDRQQAAAR